MPNNGGFDGSSVADCVSIGLGRERGANNERTKKTTTKRAQIAPREGGREDCLPLKRTGNGITLVVNEVDNHAGALDNIAMCGSKFLFCAAVVRYIQRASCFSSSLSLYYSVCAACARKEMRSLYCSLVCYYAHSIMPLICLNHRCSAATAQID